MSDYDYSLVPPRKWGWYVENDPGLHCPADKVVELTPNGLAYTGECYNPNWGGGYTIGFQTCHEFMANGPLAEQMPEATAFEIRAHLEAHRTPGSAPVLTLVVRMPSPEKRWLERCDCSLDGAYLTTTPGTPQTYENRIFQSPIALGKHHFEAAFITQGEPPGIAYSKPIDFEVQAGQHCTLEFAVADRAATAKITLTEAR